ncbi:MAG: NADH-quinone oxidoreductase subunit NuoG [Anaerolineales bacterium]
MSDPQVTLTITGRQVTVPKGTLLVDAAKKAGIYIPVFCYHPKLDPVGMCRMCLVEIGRPKKDRDSGDFVRDENGDPVIEFGGKLETACTTPVGEGWVVNTASQKALEGQGQIVEFLLTSHPLDCPVCDKGGECPLQELTMDFGAGKSRFSYGDKMHLGKHIPLGDLIYLDQERCIQCARCTRFQDELVDDPVIGFEERGRKLQIVTYSDPGFDSYFSGNTTDICPVGALTTADFRFEARPWEMKAAASICTHCPVGCNTMINTRRQPNADGQVTVQRVLPRQNEAVNEIWLCDKGRFAHHYGDSSHRLTQPLVRKDGQLVEASWDEAIERVADGLKAAGDSLVGIAGGRVSNEDLFTFKRAIESLGGRTVLADEMGGGEFAAAHAAAPGTNLKDLGQGDAVLVIASDLHEEAPIWWMRLKQAAERGASLIVANARPTRLDKFASHVVRYRYPAAATAASALLAAATGAGKAGQVDAAEDAAAAGQALADSENVLVFYGREGLAFDGSARLAQILGDLLAAIGKQDQPLNGLIPVWPHNNTQGAWDMGLRTAADGLADALQDTQAVWLMAVDPAADSPAAQAALEAAEFVVVQELYRSQSAEMADVVLPAQSYLEREGTFTSGDRRVQRFYPVLPPTGDAHPDWKTVTLIADAMGISLESRAPATVFSRITNEVPAYQGLDYQALAEAESQWPRVGGEDLYFGGTSFANRQGIGVQLGPDEVAPPESAQSAAKPMVEGLLLVPIERLYDHGRTVTASEVLQPRLARRQLWLNPNDAKELGVVDGNQVEIRWNEQAETIPVKVSGQVPTGAVLVGRSMGVSVAGPQPVEVRAIEGVSP